MISELWTGLTGVSVYALFRVAAYLSQLVTNLVPLSDKGPGIFLESTLSWGGAMSAAATFLIITLYQVAVLIKRLWGGFNNVN